VDGERYGTVEGEILNGGLKEIRNFRGRDIDRRMERHGMGEIH
jgi:hypothetical protein